MCDLPNGIDSKGIGIRVIAVFGVEHDVLEGQEGFIGESSLVDVPIGTKDIQTLTKHIIVNEARVEGKDSHEQNNVATPKEYIPDLQTQFNSQLTSNTPFRVYNYSFQWRSLEMETRFPYFTSFLPFKLFFLDDHPSSKENHDAGMSRIPKHPSKEEWESNNGIWCRVHFPISSNSIGINQVLKPMSELVESIECRWILGCVHPIQNGWNC